MHLNLFALPIPVLISMLAAQTPVQPPTISRPDAFPTLVNPNCSHCRDEARRRVKELRDAFAAMTKDEQFLKEAEKIGLEVGLIRGEDLNRDIESTLRDKRLMDLYRTIASVK